MRRWIKEHSELYIAASFELQRFGPTRRFLHKLGIARSIDELTGHNVWNETVLQASRDLRAWEDVVPVRLATESQAVQDTASVGAPHRFYRVIAR